MIGRTRPVGYREAIDTARAVTDYDRTDLDAYCAVARKIVKARLDAGLAGLPLSDERREQIIESEIFNMAQPAHLSDASVRRPIALMAMLNEIGAFGPPEEL